MPTYLLLINGATEGAPPPERMAEHAKEWEAYTRSLHETGVHVDDNRLAFPPSSPDAVERTELLRRREALNDREGAA